MIRTTPPRRVSVRRKRRTPRVVHSERTQHITGHKRVRLYGAAREKRRAEVFERAGGRCEEMVIVMTYGLYAPNWYEKVRCPNHATEWSHRRHAANKCDCFSPDCNIASCHGCHEKIHNPKPITVTKKSLREDIHA